MGFPRSGTTLIDTILRSHSEIEVIEEKPLISNLANIIEKKYNTNLEDLYSISEEKILILRKKYNQLLNRREIINLLLHRIIIFYL